MIKLVKTSKDKKYNFNGFIKDTFRSSGNRIKRSLLNSYVASKSGRIYSIKGRRHQASAPGETPAKFNGRYGKSFGFNFNNRFLEVGLGVEYAKFLELGTSRMKPRPGLKNAIKVNERRIKDIIRKNIRKGL